MIWALIDGSCDFMPQIAEAALQKAAATKNVRFTAYKDTPAGFSVRADGTSADAVPTKDDFLLLVGNVKAPVPFAGVPLRALSFEEVLDDPIACIDAAVRGGAAVSKKIVAITSCPTGIAHTFMAAEGLEQGAAALGHTIHVETQGTVGAESELSAAEIEAADLVIIAADREIDLSRFAGKMLFMSGTNPAIIDGEALIKKAFTEARLCDGRTE